MTNKRSTHTNTGFTLLELICVIAVIFLLVALLVPSLSKVRSISTRVVCSTNLRGLGTISAVYLNEYDNLFPDPNEWLYAAQSNTPDRPIGCRWHDSSWARPTQFEGTMSPYLSEGSLSICPEFRDYAKKRECENPSHNPAITLRPQNNYSMNAYMGSQRTGGVKSVAAVVRPAGKFLFAEENSWSLRPDHPRYPARWLTAPLSTKALDDTALLITPSPNAENCFATFHGASRNLSDGTGNLAFLDGHVGTISAEEQLRAKMHNGSSPGKTSNDSYDQPNDPAGNLRLAWPLEEPPPGGWDQQ